MTNVNVSARENILLYLAATLGTVAGITVYRSREAAVARAEGVVLLIRPVEETVVKSSEELTVRELTISISLVARGDVADSVADPYLVLIQAAIQADTTLGGRAARSIERQSRWDFEVADMTGLVAETLYIIKYMTPTGSLSQLA